MSELERKNGPSAVAETVTKDGRRIGTEVLFSAKDITKTFGGTQALKGVELEIHPGEIVGLVGENGAGKSTLLKIIIGAQPQTSGTMSFHGAPYEPKTPMDANKAGVGMVFQEQSLIVTLNVAQNIFFGHEKDFKRAGVINWAKMNRAAAEVLAAVDITNISPTKKVSDLNFATRQMVEIAKVMNVTKQSGSEHCLILLDEPTSVLNEAEVENLYKQMRKIAAQGHAVIFVSHHLNEILEVTDRIYVYKDGTSVGSLDTRDADEAKLYEMMVGQSTTTEYYHLDRQTAPQDDVLLEAKDLGLHGIFKHVNFQLHRGEVLGIIHVKLKVPSFIASLGFMSLWQSVALLITQNPESVPKALWGTVEWYKIAFGVVGLPLIVAIAIILFIHCVTRYTPSGRTIFAIGGNERTARVAGMGVDRTKILVFAINGVLAALAGIFLAANLRSSAPTIGDPFTLKIVAACALGGTSLAGGKGSELGTILGVFTVAIIENGMNFIGVNAYYQNIVFGIFVLAAIALTVDRSIRGQIVK